MAVEPLSGTAADAILRKGLPTPSPEDEKRIAALQRMAETLSANLCVHKGAPLGAKRIPVGMDFDLDKPAGDFGGVEWEKLLGFLQAAGDRLSVKTAQSQLKTIKDSLNSRHAKRMADINKSIDKARDAEKAAKRMKILAIFGVIFAAAFLAVSIIFPPASAGLAAFMITMSAVGLALATVDCALSLSGGDKKLLKWMADVLQKMHPDWSTSKCRQKADLIYGITSLVLGVSVAIVSVGGGIAVAKAASKAALAGELLAGKAMLGAKVGLVTGGVGAASSTVSGGLGIDSAQKGYRAALAQSKLKETEAEVRRHMDMAEQATKWLEEAVDRLQGTLRRMVEVIDGRNSNLALLAENMGNI